jgi:hypothetical protein
MVEDTVGGTLNLDQFIGFWRKLWVTHYDNKNQESLG